MFASARFLIVTSVVLVLYGSLGAHREPAVRGEFSDWSLPVNLGAVVNSPFNEQHPAVSPDDLSLYFISDRPDGFGGFDLWVSQRANRDIPWGPPTNLGATLNSPAGEFAPAFDPSGHYLFFGSERPGGCGGGDLWISFRQDTRDDFGWQSPVNLGCSINSPGFDDGPTFFIDEKGTGTLYFISDRPGGVGDRDVWQAVQRRNGAFGEPTNVVELNSPASDSRPAVRSDGLEFFVTSQRVGSVPMANGAPSSDLWVSQRQRTRTSWSEPGNVEPLNSDAVEAAPALSRRATTMYFHSSGSGGFGATDLYVTARRRINGEHEGWK